MTGVVPVTGAVTPGIAAMLTTAAVRGNWATTTPESIWYVTGFALATVKEFKATPSKVKPVLAVKTIVAV